MPDKPVHYNLPSGSGGERERGVKIRTETHLRMPKIGSSLKKTPEQEPHRRIARGKQRRSTGQEQASKRSSSLDPRTAVSARREGCPEGASPDLCGSGVGPGKDWRCTLDRSNPLFPATLIDTSGRLSPSPLPAPKLLHPAWQFLEERSQTALLSLPFRRV